MGSKVNERFPHFLIVSESDIGVRGRQRVKGGFKISSIFFESSKMSSLLPSKNYETNLTNPSKDNRADGSFNRDASRHAPSSVVVKRKQNILNKTNVVPRSRSAAITVTENAFVTSSEEQTESEFGKWKLWRQSICQLISRIGQAVMSLLEGATGRNTESGEIEQGPLRYVPDGIERILAKTKFDKQELKSLYRNFKNECPYGVINEDTLKEIYSQFFPGGDSEMYAHFVFNAFDQEENGYVNFEEFAVGLSLLLRGTDDDKLNWTFQLYDINHDGYISRNEVLEIIKAVYKLLGRDADPTIDEDVYEEHTDRVFEKFDRGRNGKVTREMFCLCCKNDESIMQSMNVFPNAL